MYIMLLFYFTDVIVGFENSSVTVTENELRAELCIRVFVPNDTEPLAFSFFLDPLTVAGTAGIYGTYHSCTICSNLFNLFPHRRE